MKILKRFVIILVIVVILLAFALPSMLDSTETQSALTKQEHAALFASEENGYHLYLEAVSASTDPDRQLQTELGALMKQGEVSDAVRNYLQQNSEALDLLRQGLAKELCIAPPYDGSTKKNLDEKTGLRRLARTLTYEGRMKGLAGDDASELDCYLDALKLGRTSMKGGVLFDGQMGIAIQMTALSAINDSFHSYKEYELQRVVEALESAADQSVSFSETKAYESSAVPSSFLQRLLTRGMLQKTFDRAEDNYLDNEVELRGIALRARVRLYELEHGSAPASLSEVMNGKPVPIDPFSGEAFQYRNGMIYSDGADRDDGDASRNSQSGEDDLNRVF
jgi:competence protein ComGC